jgi:hypothetical protein
MFICSPEEALNTVLSSFRGNTLNNVVFICFVCSFVDVTDDLQVLLPRGLKVIGALFVSDTNGRDNALKVGDICSKLRKYLLPMQNESSFVIGVAATINKDDIEYFIYMEGNSSSIEAFKTVIHEEKSAQYLWDAACLLHCQMSLNLPVYLASNKSSVSNGKLI